LVDVVVRLLRQRYSLTCHPTHFADGHLLLFRRGYCGSVVRVPALPSPFPGTFWFATLDLAG
jgi:hypothetical protein